MMNHLKPSHVSDNHGFVALITVLIIVAVSLIIGVMVVYKSVTEAQKSLTETYSTQAWAAVNGCAEYALGQLAATTTAWDLPSALNGQLLSIGPNTCYILSVTATSSACGGDCRLIKASSTVASLTRKLEVVVATNTPNSIVYTWQEVGDFSP